MTVPVLLMLYSIVDLDRTPKLATRNLIEMAVTVSFVDSVFGVDFVCFENLSALITINWLPAFFFVKGQRVSTATISSGSTGGKDRSLSFTVVLRRILAQEWYLDTAANT